MEALNVSVPTCEITSWGCREHGFPIARFSLRRSSLSVDLSNGIGLFNLAFNLTVDWEAGEPAPRSSSHLAVSASLESRIQLPTQQSKPGAFIAANDGGPSGIFTVRDITPDQPLQITHRVASRPILAELHHKTNYLPR
jgi:hypothetical protein